jgi:hypothetical protein
MATLSVLKFNARSICPRVVVEERYRLGAINPLTASRRIGEESPERMVVTPVGRFPVVRYGLPE